jgi:NADPH:quinone reductase-like Zn-dependent oxidoreductase
MVEEQTRMRAVTIDRYGPPDVLRLEDVERPVPGDAEVLVRVVAGSANPRDWHFMRGLPYIARPQLGLRKPRFRLPGSDVAGVVEALGGGATRFAPGDEVFGHVESGGFSEYVCVPESVLARKASNLTFEEAAVVPLAATTALQGLRHGGVRAGQRVLVVGASGGVGSFAVQIAKSLGAHVTGVCSTANVELVRSLGADEVIDYTSEDFTAGGPRYDVILQLGGTISPRACRRALTHHGVLVSSSGDGGGRWMGPIGRIVSALLLSPFVSQKLGPFTAKASAEDLDTLRTMIEAGEVRPVIERTFPLSEVSEAIRRVETGHVRGKLAIAVQPAMTRADRASER